MEQQAHSIWFVRKGKAITGPFTAGLISQYILLGRIGLEDELSNDRQHWDKVGQHDELIPAIMKADLSEPYNQERLQAAIRWADERHEFHGAPDSMAERRQGNETNTPVRPTLESKPVISRGRKLGSLILSLSILLAIIYAAIRFTPDDELVSANCQAAAAPGVVWNNCQLPGYNGVEVNLRQAQIRNANLSGADLRGADLSASSLKYTLFNQADLRGSTLKGASLVGASLQNARLQNADLELADLAYADLQGANIQGVRWNGARLANTIWIDGRVCASHSIGQCLAKP